MARGTCILSGAKLSLLLAVVQIGWIPTAPNQPNQEIVDTQCKTKKQILSRTQNRFVKKSCQEESVSEESSDDEELFSDTFRAGSRSSELNMVIPETEQMSYDATMHPTTVE